MGDAATVDLSSQEVAPIGEHRSSSDPAASHSSQGNGPHSSDAGVKSESARSSPSNGLTKAIAAVKDKKDPLNSNKGCSPASSNPRLKASRSNFTVPQPFSLTTEKRATLAGSAGSKSAGNGVPTPTRTQKVVTKRVESPALCTKSTGSLKTSTPSPIGSTTLRSKVEFVFKSDERAQKRMEFYANLNEKSKAREAERSRIQANTQQQMAADIKKLRKDQTFKATPMPKFYHEPPPVRIDVKKTPPTRPKSPKLGRRGSSGDTAAGGAPKIIARRSSDEYQVVDKVDKAVSDPSSAEAVVAKVEQEAPKSAEESTHEQQSLHDLDHEGSEHSSSRKSDQVIPKAALSEEDEDIHPAATSHVNETGSTKENLAAELGSRGSGQSSLAEDFEGMLQLPVSSSLLEDGEEDLGSDFENDHHDLDREEFPSPGSQDQEEHEEQQNVRVYISEEFRQAAAAAAAAQDHSQGDHEEQEEEEFDEVDEENDLDAANPRVFVNLDGLITKTEDQELEEEEEQQRQQQ